jgi:hypothetical protein
MLLYSKSGYVIHSVFRFTKVATKDEAVEGRGFVHIPKIFGVDNLLDVLPGWGFSFYSQEI